MPKIVDREQKRIELLSGCFGLFAKRGYSSVTMREIARTLDVSTGTLYHYFPNKQELFVMMVEFMSQQDVLTAREQIRVEGSLSKKLDALFRFLQDNEAHFQHLVMLALDFCRHQEPDSAPGLLETTIDRYRLALEEELGLPPDTGWGSLLFSIVSGMIIQRMMAPHTTSFDHHKESLRRMAYALLPNDKGSKV